MPNAFTHTPLFNLRSHNLERTHFPQSVLLSEISAHTYRQIEMDKKSVDNQIPKVFPDYIVKFKKREIIPLLPKYTH